MIERQVFLDIEKVRKDKIVDFLPGIFYVYEKKGNEFELIHWNENHEKVTGYAPEELKGKKVFEFFYPFDFEVIKEGLSEILQKGVVKQVFANLRLKNGETLPFLFEGYKFMSGDKVHFLGVGLDVSSYVMTRRQLSDLRDEVLKKNKELLIFSEQNSDLMKLKDELTLKFKALREMDSIDQIRSGMMEIERRLTVESRKLEMWEVFKLRFNEVHQDFFTDLREKHPELTNSEVKYLAYLKIKLSGFQIGTLLNVSKDAIKKKRYRIRKKLRLDGSLSLEEFVDRF